MTFVREGVNQKIQPLTYRIVLILLVHCVSAAAVLPVLQEGLQVEECPGAVLAADPVPILFTLAPLLAHVNVLGSVGARVLGVLVLLQQAVVVVVVVEAVAGQRRLGLA